MAFTCNMRILILTASRFVIIRVQFCLDFSPSSAALSVQKPGSGAYTPQILVFIGVLQVAVEAYPGNVDVFMRNNNRDAPKTRPLPGR